MLHKKNLTRPIWRLLVAACLLLALIPSLGQGDGAAPELPDGVEAFDVDVLFPVALRFHVELDLPPEDVESVTLEVALERQLAQDVDVDLDEVLDEESEDAAVLDVRWIIPVEDTPRFMSDIDYEMVIATDDGAEIILEGTVVYANPDVRWVRDDDENDRLSFVMPAGSVGTGTLRDVLGDVYTLLLSHGRGLPDFRLAIDARSVPLNPCRPNDDGDDVILDEVVDEELECEGRAESSVTQINYEVVTMQSLDLGVITEAIVPIMTDSFFAETWADVDIPLWFAEGLDKFLQPAGNFGDVTLSRSMVRDGIDFRLEEMESLPEDEFSRQQWRAQAYTMLLYMMSQSGVQGVFRLARTVGEEGETFAESYERSIGQPLEALIPSWRVWIFRQEAEVATSLDLFAGPTEPPEPTETATPFPPTRGPTLTPTVTPTRVYVPPPTSTRLPTDTPTPFFGGD